MVETHSRAEETSYGRNKSRELVAAGIDFPSAQRDDVFAAAALGTKLGVGQRADRARRGGDPQIGLVGGRVATTVKDITVDRDIVTPIDQHSGCASQNGRGRDGHIRNAAAQANRVVADGLS